MSSQDPTERIDSSSDEEFNCRNDETFGASKNGDLGVCKAQFQHLTKIANSERHNNNDTKLKNVAHSSRELPNSSQNDSKEPIQSIPSQLCNVEKLEQILRKQVKFATIDQAQQCFHQQQRRYKEPNSSRNGGLQPHSRLPNAAANASSSQMPLAQTQTQTVPGQMCTVEEVEQIMLKHAKLETTDQTQQSFHKQQNSYNEISGPLAPPGCLSDPPGLPPAPLECPPSTLECLPPAPLGVSLTPPGYLSVPVGFPLVPQGVSSGAPHFPHGLQPMVLPSGGSSGQGGLVWSHQHQHSCYYHQHSCYYHQHSCSHYHHHQLPPRLPRILNPPHVLPLSHFMPVGGPPPPPPPGFVYHNSIIPMNFYYNFQPPPQVAIMPQCVHQHQAEFFQGQPQLPQIHSQPCENQPQPPRNQQQPPRNQQQPPENQQQSPRNLQRPKPSQKQEQPQQRGGSYGNMELGQQSSSSANESQNNRVDCDLGASGDTGDEYAGLFNELERELLRTMTSTPNFDDNNVTVFNDIQVKNTDNISEHRNIQRYRYNQQSTSRRYGNHRNSVQKPNTLRKVQTVKDTQEKNTENVPGHWRNQRYNNRDNQRNGSIGYDRFHRNSVVQGNRQSIRQGNWQDNRRSLRNRKRDTITFGDFLPKVLQVFNDREQEENKENVEPKRRTNRTQQDGDASRHHGNSRNSVDNRQSARQKTTLGGNVS